MEEMSSRRGANVSRSQAGIPNNAPRVGERVDGKYELVRLIGRGGMGEVYEARHCVIGRRVAVKFILADYARLPEIASRFANEARAAGGVEHENIAGVYDVGTLADGSQYLVMEFLSGCDLSQLALAESPLSPARAADVIYQAASGLAAVHERGVVHRDLKPSNLFVTRRGDNTALIKIIDFGIAKFMARGASATKTGVTLGTASYMSPEQARGGRDVGPATDIYALGVILYELLAGERPFRGESLVQVLHRVMAQDCIPLHQRSPSVPSELCAVVSRAMALRAEDRFPDAASLGRALLPFTGRSAPLAREVHGNVGSVRVQRAGDETVPHVAEAAPPLERGMSRETSDVGIVRSVNVRVSGTTGRSPPPGASRRRQIAQRWTLSAVALVALGAGARTWHTHSYGPLPTVGAARGDAALAHSAPPSSEVARVAPLLDEPEEWGAPDTAGPDGTREHEPPDAAARAFGSPHVLISSVRPRKTPRVFSGGGSAVPVSCTPPFTLDHLGHHQYKPECIR